MRTTRPVWACVLIVLLAGVLAVSCRERETPPSGGGIVARRTPGATRTPSKPTPTPLMIMRDGHIVPIYQLNPSTVDNTGLQINTIDELNLTGIDPGFDAETWSMQIDGAVDRPMTLTYADILARPVMTDVVLLICPGVFADNAEWSGISLASLLRDAGIRDDASEIRMEGGDNYVFRVKKGVALAENAMLAYRVNGEPLPSEHGFPLRAVFPGEYGNTWVKWLIRITVIPLGGERVE